MINKIQSSIIVLLFISINSLQLSAQRRQKKELKYDNSYDYKLETIAVGVEGTKLVKVWEYGKKPKSAIINAKKTAVACAIFKGLPSVNNRDKTKTPAMIREDKLSDKQILFLREFFNTGGGYLEYVKRTTTSPPSGRDRIKLKRRKYKIGIIVSVYFDELRTKLEEEGIVKSLDNGF